MIKLQRALLSALSPAGKRARLTIFTYHRVLPRADQLIGSPTAESFERQLRWIRQYCNPLPLADAVERLFNELLPPRAVAITFDDGYANNLEIAAPLLRKYDVPATVFVAVKAIEDGIMWNDVIIEAMRRADHEIDATAIDLGKISLDSTNRRRVLDELLINLKYRQPAERDTLARSIYSRVTNESIPRLMLTVEQLSRLPEYGIDIGAHTVRHPILRLLTDDEARAEIGDSRSWIGAVTGVEPVLFAYPNGRRGDDYDARHAEMVRSLGFRAAVSTNRGCATRKSLMFELPRARPSDVTALRFYGGLCKTIGRSYLGASRTT